MCIHRDNKLIFTLISRGCSLAWLGKQKKLHINKSYLWNKYRYESDFLNVGRHPQNDMLKIQRQGVEHSKSAKK